MDILEYTAKVCDMISESIQRKRCPKCGQDIEHGECINCGYRED